MVPRSSSPSPSSVSAPRPTSTPTSESFSQDLLRRGAGTGDDDVSPARVRFGVAPHQAPLRVDHAVHRRLMPLALLLPLALPAIPDPAHEVTVITCTVSARQLTPHIRALPMLLVGNGG